MFFSKVIFVPTPRKNLNLIMEMAGVKTGTNFFDLGSGDGRLIIEAAKLGANSTGVEINPFLVWYSRLKIKKAGLINKARVINNDFMEVDLSSADVVFTYLLPDLMEELSKKFFNELRPDTQIISQGFHIPGWRPVKMFLDDANIFERGFRRTKKIFLYVK